MKIVTLTDPDRATAAGAWLVENIGYKYWELDVQNPFHSPRYHFKFHRNEHAVVFALKWV